MTTSLAGSRVVIVNWRDPDHSLAGGSEIYAWQLAGGLRDGGAQVTYLTARDRGQAASAERDGIVVRRGGGTFGFYLFALLWLFVHRSSIDAMVDPACGLPSFSPLVVRRRTPVLLVVHHVHQEQFATRFPAPVAAFGRWLERVAMPRVYRRAEVVAVSDSTRDEMRTQLGWRGPVGILANGTHLPITAVTGAAKDGARVVVLGRLVAHKRVDLVLRAVADVRAEHPDVRVDVVGRGPEGPALARLVDDLGLGDAVTLHGFLDDDALTAVLDRAAINVCASDAEGWGQAVITAAAHGVPTLARDVPGLRDSVRDGVTGVLVPDSATADDVRRRLATALGGMLVLAASAAERDRSAAACRAWAGSFDWSHLRAAARDHVATALSGSASARPGHHSPRTSGAVLGGTSCVD